MPSINLMTPRGRGPGCIGSQLRAWRVEQAMSQSDLASVAGLSRKTIQRIENGWPPSADTVLRIECALDLPEQSIAPKWDLPPGPSDSDYGSRVRARRRALGLSLEETAAAAGVSAATLSRFERGVSTPRRWFAEWTDEVGRTRDAIIVQPLAEVLGFRDVRELHEFCMAGDVSRWAVVGDRRSTLWLATGVVDPGAELNRAFPTLDELSRAHYRSGNAKG